MMDHTVNKLAFDNLYAKYNIHWPTGVKHPGFVGQGWLPLVEQLFIELIDHGWDRELHQLKEKFSALRVYTGKMSDGNYARVGRAETASKKICEVCGKPGTLTGPRWLKTSCTEHSLGPASDTAIRIFGENND